MKNLLLSLVLIITAVGYTTAQEVITTVPTQEVVAQTPTSCEFTPVSHWSIGINGGTNYFRITPMSPTRIDQLHLTLGGTLEYTINPLAGIGLEYSYNPYGRPYYIDPTTNGSIAGETHDAIIYGSINLSNLLVPYRTGSSKLNIYGNAGVGYAFYNYSMDGAPTVSGQNPMAKIGMNLEYNISNSLALGVEAQYRFYHVNLITNGVGNNTEALATTIGLRYKFGANGNKQHARNITMCEYYPKPAPVIIEKIVKDNTTETLDRLKALEDDNAVLKQRIKDLENDSIVVTRNNNADKGVVAAYPNIEFEFGSDKLTVGSYATLDQIAETLKDNKNSVKLNVAGYTDYIGSEEYNQTLSEKRANAVKTYMSNKNVPASSVTVIGYGEKDPIATNDTEEGRQKNRRVELKITK